MRRLGSAALTATGPVLNVLPLGIHIAAQETLPELATRLAAQLKKMRRHQRYDAEQIVRDSGRAAGEEPLFGPVLNIKVFDYQLDIPGVQAQTHTLATGPVNDLELALFPDEHGDLSIEILANKQRYDEPTLIQHAERLKMLIAQFAADPALLCGDVDIMLPGEYAQLAQINATQVEIPETTLSALVAEQAAKTPHAPALVDASYQFSYREMREQVVTAKAGWCAVMRLVKDNGVERRLHRRELAYLSADELRSMSDKALGALRLAVADNEHLRDVLRISEDPKRPERKIQFFVAVYQHLRERIRQDIIRTDDPVEAIEQMEIELSRLTEELTNREQKLAISSRSVANIIRKTIQREQNRIRMLNQGLQSVSFGQVNSVRLNVNVRETHSMLLDVLSEQHEQHQDLFNSNRLTFSEALAKLYQRLNPQIDMGQRTPQTIGEELLDYRNYLEMEVEVNRGSDGWLRAESGALSTGEAIGTGMSILVMVVQSWEDESRRLRGKDISPCRLLFLDEAARLDARSIATLFELCERLEMQLIIAAPENISPEKGTTYKLVRKVFNNHEHVHVVGLRGFAAPLPEALPGTADAS